MGPSAQPLKRHRLGWPPFLLVQRGAKICFHQGGGRGPGGYPFLETLSRSHHSVYGVAPRHSINPLFLFFSLFYHLTGCRISITARMRSFRRDAAEAPTADLASLSDSK